MSDINHTVAITGYDADTRRKYWLVKNSWGDDYGEDGFMKITISKGNGICGINRGNYYPL